LPYWEQTVLPSLQSTGEVLLSAHGNIIRGIIRHVEHMADKDFEVLDVPTATPVIYEFENTLEFRRSYRLNAVQGIAATVPIAA
jgi:bisphosphoglycerate-dependent phosphoglycerate mutase